MSNEPKGPYKVTENAFGAPGVVLTGPAGSWIYASGHAAIARDQRDILNKAVELALTSQAARVRELEEDREWLRSQWERHRKALNAIAWGEYDNVAFCRRLAQDELAIGVKVANDRAAATVAALTPKEPQ